MSFCSVAAVIVLIACHRRGDVQARPRPRHEQNAAFVQKPWLLYTRGQLDEDNSYVDSTRQEYRQTTAAAAATSAVTATAPPAASASASASASALARKSSKAARDRDRDRHRTALLDADGLSPSAAAVASAKTVAFTRSDTVATSASGFSGIANLDGAGAASSLDGFASADNTASVSAPALPPAPPPPSSSFSFPPGGPAFGQFGSSSSFGGFGAGSISSGAGHGHEGGAGGGSSSEAGYNDAQPIIQKSVYVHVAPQEDQVPKQKVILPKIVPKKNFQIVFIKAPTPAPPSAPVIPPFPPQSDKTLIYVLHPKPEEAPPIHIPAPPQNAPVKPEVYFIKYKTKKEQEEDEIHGGQGYGGGGGGGGGGDVDVDVDDEGGGYHRRRYGRDGLEEEADEESESLDVTDSASGARSSATRPPLPSDAAATPYDETNDTSGESSNIVRIYTTERGGKNAH